MMRMESPVVVRPSRGGSGPPASGGYRHRHNCSHAISSSFTTSQRESRRSGVAPRSLPGAAGGGVRDPNEAGLSRDLVLKVPASMNMTPQLYTYLLAHTREQQVLKDLRAETASMNGSHMQITPDQGQLLGLLVQLMGARRAVEVGVYTGYSSLAVALALPEGGKLFALDKDERSMAVARKYWELAGVRHKVEERMGSGVQTLTQLLEEQGPGSFDIGFIDADKRAYWQYYELLLQLVRPGGLIIADNVLFYGKVAAPEASDKAALALAEFNAKLLQDSRVELSIIPVGDGMALCRKR